MPSGRFGPVPLASEPMQRPSWRSPVRWSFIALFAVIGLVSAVLGIWWTAGSAALFAVAQLASIAHERRKAVGRSSKTDP